VLGLGVSTCSFNDVPGQRTDPHRFCIRKSLLSFKPRQVFLGHLILSCAASSSSAITCSLLLCLKGKFALSLISHSLSQFLLYSPLRFLPSVLTATLSVHSRFERLSIYLLSQAVRIDAQVFHVLPFSSLIIVFRSSGKSEHSHLRTNIGSTISSRIGDASISVLHWLRHRRRLLVGFATDATSMVASTHTGAGSSLRAVAILWGGLLREWLAGLDRKGDDFEWLL
jgi:hypothetical protein